MSAASEARVERIVTIAVPDGYQAGERLDAYLAAKLPNVSRNKVQRGIKDGRVSVNDTVVRKVSTPIQAGDRLVCRILGPPPMTIEPEPIPLDIVYEDDVLLVVNKEAGMVVHPAYGHRTGTLVHALLHHVGGDILDVSAGDEEDELDEGDVGLSTVNAVPSRDGDPAVRPGIVHRLDKDTSGLLVVAKTDAAHAFLAHQFQDHTIERRYQALVWGVPDPPTGTVDTHLGRDPRDRKRMAVVGKDRGKHAVTHYETLEVHAHTALLRFHLETGRTHQIRVHARHIGHPVFGDPVYGGDRIRYGAVMGSRKAFIRNLFRALPRQALHAHTLGFVHPVTHETVHFVAPLPADMQHVLDRLRAVEGEG